MSNKERIAYLKALLFIAAADDAIEDAEKQLFVETCFSEGLTVEESEALERSVLEDEEDIENILGEIKSEEGKETLLNNLIAMCYADGNYTELEKAGMEFICETLGMDKEFLQTIEDEFKKRDSKIQATLVEAFEIGKAGALVLGRGMKKGREKAIRSVATGVDVIGERVEDYKKKKDAIIFKDGESLQQVVNVVNEAAAALQDKTRTIKESTIPEPLMAAVGAGVGGDGSFFALYGLGTVGLSASGITSGLAAAGLGFGMVSGIFVLAAPIAVLSVGGYAVASNLKKKQFKQEKERLYKEALKKHEAIIQALKNENHANKERLEYLRSLNTLLERAVTDLRKDLTYEQA